MKYEVRGKKWEEGYRHYEPELAEVKKLVSTTHRDFGTGINYYPKCNEKHYLLNHTF